MPLHNELYRDRWISTPITGKEGACEGRDKGERRGEVCQACHPAWFPEGKTGEKRRGEVCNDFLWVVNTLATSLGAFNLGRACLLVHEAQVS